MPTILYKWDFETGDTQGWTLESYVNLDNSGALQGTYSLYTDLGRTGNITSDSPKRIAYITGIDLSTATKPLLILLVRDGYSFVYPGNNAHPAIVITVKDSTGSVLLRLSEKVLYASTYSGSGTKVLVFDLSSVAGKSSLTLEIYWGAYDSYYIFNGTGGLSLYVDNIYIIDGGDKEYQIALLGVNNADKTITYTIPSDGSALPTGVVMFAVNLASPPHPLSEGSDTFTYTATCDQGSASITSTDASNKHASPITSPSTAPAYFKTLSVRIYTTSAGSTWYSFDKTVVVTFWGSSWNLLAVYVFRIAITINPYSPTYATAFINTTYGSAWSGQREFQVKIHAHSHSASVFVRFLVGDNTVVQTGSVTLTVYSSDYSTSYGSSSVDLTTGTQLQGPTISNLPVDTTVIYRISWSITANSRVVIEVRPQFIVY